MKRSLSIPAFFATLIFLTIGSTYADVEDRVEKEYRVNPGGTLTIESDLGRIEVESVRGQKVIIQVWRKIKVHSRKEADKILDNFDLEFRQHGDDVSVVAKWIDKSRFSSMRNRLQLRYKIQVPRRYNVDLRTGGGSIVVRALVGNVRVQTSGGSLIFGDITGPVFGRTSGGSITLEGCKGKADIKTSGGSIQVGRVEGSVVAHTSGGSIRVKEVMGAIKARTSGGSIKAYITRQPDDDCELITSGSSIKVYLATNLRLDIDAKTSAGSVKTELSIGKKKKSTLKGKLNGGGPLLYLRTSGGNIYLKGI
ncbi:MAG TPA: hypothetical protein EYP14_16340 [Planctomycetaceae bacterium]|nr:hypothetical protein [Planctomycetaceae bacterium]